MVAERWFSRRRWWISEGKEITGRKGLTASQAGTFTHYLAPGRYGLRVAASDPEASTTEPYALRLLD